VSSRCRSGASRAPRADCENRSHRPQRVHRRYRRGPEQPTRQSRGHRCQRRNHHHHGVRPAGSDLGIRARADRDDPRQRDVFHQLRPVRFLPGLHPGTGNQGKRVQAGGRRRLAETSMRYPPRLAHLATRAVVVAKLWPTFAAAHQLDEDDARARLDAALRGSLLEELLAHTWNAMRVKHRRLDDATLLQKVADSLAERPLRPGRTAKLNPQWSAFLLLSDLQAGTASDAARRALETESGRKASLDGLAEAGRHLADELT